MPVWHAFLAWLPSVRTFGKEAKKWHISSVYRGIKEYRQPKCRCSERSTRRISQYLPQSQTIMFLVPIDHSVVLSRPKKKKTEKPDSKRKLHILRRKRNMLRLDEEKMFHIYIVWDPFSFPSRYSVYITSMLNYYITFRGLTTYLYT